MPQPGVFSMAGLPARQAEVRDPVHRPRRPLAAAGLDGALHGSSPVHCLKPSLHVPDQLQGRKSAVHVPAAMACATTCTIALTP